ncbi:GT4 family glycosyltransferase PelF [Fodinisporobacter ferrooxydans]|uniref:GT4 family glycosyltransferase PelF n=1 Tax=Fodinisporobacter ferrooxydans TaxID=2901836 RepID=A0ABY4CIF8_9BACL|nr:GT4 family glycosyltransferase PelF [Alicyclobacillaceae bacterium MYW30-H2]
MNDRIKVLLTTEGTYPFYQGGVSTWCDLLVKELDAVDYTIYTVLANPFVTQKFKLPKQSELLKMPLWGTEEPSEHIPVPFSEIYLAKKRTTDPVIRQMFLPLFKELILEIISEENHPQYFGQILSSLHLFFQEYEYKEAFKSELTWNTFKEIILDAVASQKYRLTQPDVYGLIQTLSWVYRFLNIINTPIPKTHVTHASAAAFCGIPCVIAKMQNQTPYLLTEHGVYLREQYISLTKSGYSSYMNTFLLRFVQSVVNLNYAFADQVSPVCAYNSRWEKRFGVPMKRVKVIYNGIDHQLFSDVQRKPNSDRTVVMVARIDPIKDILTFIRAAAHVRQQMPDVKFIIFGSVSVPAYYTQCLDLRDKLQLNEQLIFAGHTDTVAGAYQRGDIVVLSSISEAFPYSVVEAMMSARPVVATDVGGIREALGDTGILVRPRDPEGLAAGMTKLLQNAELRSLMGNEARERALNLFTLDKVLELHLKSYIQLAVKAEEKVVSFRKSNQNEMQAGLQKLYMEKGYALSANGFYKEAIGEFQNAIQVNPKSSSVPILLSELAKVYNRLGDYNRSFQELEKLQAFIDNIDSINIA